MVMVDDVGSRRDLAPALSRGIKILDLLAARRGEPVGLGEIAHAIGAARSSTSNLCTVLRECGLIERHPDGYRLGRRTAELGGAYLSSFDQVREFYRLCLAAHALREQLVKVATLDGTDALYLARHEGRAPLRLSASIGDRFPAASTSVGNVLLSQLADDEVARRFSDAAAFPAWTESSTRDLAELTAKLSRVRERGYATEEGAVLPGVDSIAVALPAARLREARLALGVSFMAATTSEARRDALLEELLWLRDALTDPFEELKP